MNCQNCGNMLQPGVMVCPYCGTPVNQGMQQPMQPMGQAMQPMNGPMMQQPYMAPPKKKHTVLYVILGIIGVIVIAAVAIVIFCKKLTCKGTNGSFTVYYTSSDIIACTTTGTVPCELDELKEAAKTYGVDTTIEALRIANTKAGGVCSN